MVRWGAALLLMLGVPVWVAAQEGTDRPYTQADSPFMGSFDFGLRSPVEVFVEVAGVRLDTIRVDTQGAVAEGARVRCQVTATGSNVGTARPRVVIMMLLEDEKGNGLVRFQIEEFRPRPGRAFEEGRRVEVNGDALLQARKIFVMLEVS